MQNRILLVINHLNLARLYACYTDLHDLHCTIMYVHVVTATCSVRVKHIRVLYQVKYDAAVRPSGFHSVRSMLARFVSSHMP